MDALLQEIRDRDARDMGRSVAPLRKVADAVELDTTNLSVDEAVARVLTWYQERASGTP